MMRFAAALTIVLLACGGAGQDSDSALASATASTDPTSATTPTDATHTDSSGVETSGEACLEVDELFSQRIEPLLATDRPKSCNQCHLSGIDLASFVRNTPCATMACMVERGLVDLESPAESLVLDWIARATPSGLITEDVIAEEYAGFLAWIEGAAVCGGCADEVDPCGDGTQPALCGADEPPLGFDDPGGCEAKTLEALFRNKVYAWRDRCYPCHFAGKEQQPDAPKWIAVGSCELASLETMRGVTKAGYVDLGAPADSLLLLKPLAEVAGGVEHGGHDKFADEADLAYQDFLYWTEREAECASERSR